MIQEIQPNKFALDGTFTKNQQRTAHTTHPEPRRARPIDCAPVLDAGGEPSTWFPPGAVEQSDVRLRRLSALLVLSCVSFLRVVSVMSLILI